MNFIETLKWMFAYKKKHPKANKAQLAAALKLQRMKDTYTAKKPSMLNMTKM